MKKSLLKISFLSIIVMMLFAVSACGNGSDSSNAGNKKATVGSVNKVLSAKLDEDNKGYFVTENGTVICINDEVDVAMLTKDRQHVVVRTVDGVIYFSDAALTEKKKVAEDSNQLLSICDTGFTYEGTDGMLCKVFYESGEVIEITKDWDRLKMSDTLDIVYTIGTGSASSSTESSSSKKSGVFLVKATEAEAEKIGNVSSKVSFNYISSNAEFIVWSDVSSNTLDLIAYENGDSTKLATDLATSYSWYTNVTSNISEDTIVITNYAADCFWIKQKGKEVVKAKLPNDGSATVYTPNYYLYADASTPECIYICTDSNDGNSNLYYYTMDGERERVLSNIKKVFISNGNIAYIDSDDVLFYGKLNKEIVEESVKIAGDVEGVLLTANGKYMLYEKDTDSDYQSVLYMLKIGDESATKVSSDVYSYYETSDSDTVLYIKNTEKIGSTYTRYGTLYLYKYGEEPVKVASDAMPDISYNYYRPNVVNASRFVFEKYSSVDSDSHIFENFIKYENGETETLVKDVIR